MFEIIEKVNLAILVDRFSCNDFLVLRHVSRSVDFSLVINLNVNRDPRLLVVRYSCPPDANSAIIQGVLLIISGVL